MRQRPWILSLTVVAALFGAAQAGELDWPADRFGASAATSVAALPGGPPVLSPAEAERASGETADLLSPPRTPEAVFHDCPNTPFPRFPLCKVSFGPYGWLPEIHGQVGVRNVTTEVDVTTRDLLNLIEHNAHFVFAGQMEIDYGHWSVTSSGLYIYAGFARDIRRLSFSGNGSFAVVDAVLGYEIPGLAQELGLQGGSEIELLAGARYWLVGGNLTITGPFGNSPTRGNDVDWVDPVVGARLTYVMRPDLRLRLRGDVGGFGWWHASEETWNVEAMIEKRCSPYCTIAAGYRILDVDYDRGNSRERFAFDAQMRGPVANVSLEF